MYRALLSFARGRGSAQLTKSLEERVVLRSKSYRREVFRSSSKATYSGRQVVR